MTDKAQHKANVIHISEGNHGLLIRHRDGRVSGNPVKKSILLFSNFYFIFHLIHILTLQLSINRIKARQGTI